MSCPHDDLARSAARSFDSHWTLREVHRWPHDLELRGPTGWKPLDVSGPLLVGFETDAQGISRVGFELANAQLGQEVTANVEAVILLDDGAFPLLHANLAAASACATSGGPGTVDGDSDGGGDGQSLGGLPARPGVRAARRGRRLAAAGRSTGRSGALPWAA